jgi:hypothetical protein
MIEVEFSFELDEQGKLFCSKIASDMVRLFNIPTSEAVGRINKQWKTVKIIGPSLLYHQSSDEWAKTIYYEDGTFWWVDEWMAKNTPKSKPYP